MVSHVFTFTFFCAVPSPVHFQHFKRKFTFFNERNNEQEEEWYVDFVAILLMFLLWTLRCANKTIKFNVWLQSTLFQKFACSQTVLIRIATFSGIVLDVEIVLSIKSSFLASETHFFNWFSVPWYKISAIKEKWNYITLFANLLSGALLYLKEMFHRFWRMDECRWLRTMQIYWFMIKFH